MAIDFTLTAQQQELQRASRKFAKEVLVEAKRAESLATPEERFGATKPTCWLASAGRGHPYQGQTRR